MASTMWQTGELSLIDTWLFGGTSRVPTATSGNFGVGLGALAGGIAGNPSKALDNSTNDTAHIGEIGVTTPANYSRFGVLRTQGAGGWGAASVVSNDYQTTATQATFTFTGSPNLNGATIWFLAKTNGSPGTNDCFFGADLAATRNFTNGDTEKVTITYRQQ
jgi:hypothetical protein